MTFVVRVQPLEHPLELSVRQNDAKIKQQLLEFASAEIPVSA